MHTQNPGRSPPPTRRWRRPSWSTRTPTTNLATDYGVLAYQLRRYEKHSLAASSTTPAAARNRSRPRPGRSSLTSSGDSAATTSPARPRRKSTSSPRPPVSWPCCSAISPLRRRRRTQHEDRRGPRDARAPVHNARARALL